MVIIMVMTMGSVRLRGERKRIITRGRRGRENRSLMMGGVFTKGVSKEPKKLFFLHSTNSLKETQEGLLLLILAIQVYQVTIMIIRLEKLEVTFVAYVCQNSPRQWIYLQMILTQMIQKSVMSISSLCLRKMISTLKNAIPILLIDWTVHDFVRNRRWVLELGFIGVG